MTNDDFKKLGLSNIAVGTYKFDVFDVDIATGCESLPREITFEVAPGAETTILGDTAVCANTFESLYILEKTPVKASTYTWKVTGSRVIFSKDGPNSPMRVS